MMSLLPAFPPPHLELLAMRRLLLQIVRQLPSPCFQRRDARILP
jgi:hypothetical protein